MAVIKIVKRTKIREIEYKLLKKLILILTLGENFLSSCKKNIAKKTLINYCITIDNKNTENVYA